MSPSNERSAEWLRGRKEAIFEIYDAWKCMDSAPFRHYIHEIADDALASDDIAAAEAREAAPGDSLSTTVEKLREACSGVRVAPEPDAPTAAQVIGACEKALHHERQGLQNLIDFRGFWFGGERRYGALTMEELTEAMVRMEAVSALCARWKEANSE